MKDCPVCAVEGFIAGRLRAEGCRLADFDAPAVIAGRLFEAGVRIGDVRADSVSSAVFWRAVYGPAYPAAVEPKPFDASDPSTYARTISIDGMSPDEYFATDPAR